MTFVMMNPSTADGQQDDATLRSCRRIAQHNGFLRLSVLNVMAFRATKPATLLAAADPRGPLNALWQRTHIEGSRGPIVCAWGQIHKRLARHEAATIAVLAEFDIQDRLCLLKQAKDGRPVHPLYQSPGTRLQPVRLALGRDATKAGGNRLVQSTEGETAPFAVA